jgi:S-adenosylmethionine:tRNA ribosyltransferase-isomerase
MELTVERTEDPANPGTLRFSWIPGEIPFSKMIETFGKVPLPPYIHREAEKLDISRYQTIFALNDGSVAAPTAGLHFTGEVLEKLKQRKITVREITLHVGAGTFIPVTSGTVDSHVMHAEVMLVTRALIKDLISKHGPLIAVGTTTVRTLESLYWLGVKIIRKQPFPKGILVEQWEPYASHDDSGITCRETFEALLSYMEHNGMDYIAGPTRLMIIPGYRYKAVDVMITNFHQPGSTLLLLVAGFIGRDWQRTYSYALRNGFRFLSYGDSCLFFKGNTPDG